MGRKEKCLPVDWRVGQSRKNFVFSRGEKTNQEILPKITGLFGETQSTRIEKNVALCVHATLEVCIVNNWPLVSCFYSSCQQYVLYNVC